MVYPETPFTNKFDSASVLCLNKTDDSVGISEEPNLVKLLQWLCRTPETTSYRINTHKYTLEYVKSLLESALKKSSKCSDVDTSSQILPHPCLPDVLLVKPWDEHNLHIDRRDKEVIVDPVCGAAILRGSHIFAPGVMAMEPGTKLDDIVSIYVDVSKKCKKGLRIPFECSKKVFIGNGEVKMTRFELFGDNLDPSGIAVKMIETISHVPSLDTSALPPDSFLLQNIPSVVCGHVLCPLPGEVVLDMCASPGNKSTHLGTLMKNQGILIALDKTLNKVSQLTKNCQDFSLSCIHTFLCDSTKACCEKLDITHKHDIIKGPPFAKDTFDKILLDAPCSNLGRRPQLYNDITNKEARSFVPLQRKLFTNAVNLLKPGGHLVYSTCTITLSENEGIVYWALETFPCLELRLATPSLGGPGWPGTKLTEEQRNIVQRFGPDQSDDCIGFFLAHFVKI